MPPPPIRPGRSPFGPAPAQNTYQNDINGKLLGDNRVTSREAESLVQGWSSGQLTERQATQLRQAVNSSRSTFEAGAAAVIDRFVNVTLPTLTIQQGLNGIPPTSARLTWTAPTRNEDGTPLTNLKGYEVVYGRTPGNLTNVATIDDPARTTFQVDNLASGTWYFAMRAINTSGQKSALTGEVSKTIP